jgi:hypothetical protein
MERLRHAGGTYDYRRDLPMFSTPSSGGRPATRCGT